MPIAAVVLAAAVYFYFWASRTGTAQFDEHQYVWLARWIDVDPAAALNFSEYLRGLQRLEVWLLAAPLSVLSGPDALLAGRALNGLLFASTAIPVSLLARGVGVPRTWAWATGALCVAVPWAVVTTSLLTENVAYPAFAWFLLATWRTLLDGGPRRDAIAILSVVVAALARTSLLMLAVALPLAVIAHGLRFGPRALLVRHAVLWAAVGAALVAVGLSAAGALPPVHDLGGVYGGGYGTDPGLIAQRTGFFLSRLAVGTGFLPLGLALAWGAWQVVRPADARTHALAVVAAAAAVCVLVPTAAYTIAHPSVFEERYLVYLAPLPFLGAAAAVARRDVAWWALAAGAVLGAALVGAADWTMHPQPYDSFTSPAMRFYALDLDLGERWTVPVLAGAAGVGLALGLRTPRSARGATIALAAGLGVLQLAAVQSTMSAFADGPGERHGPSPERRGWVDRAIHGRGRALILGEGLGNTQPFAAVWAELQFWNTSVAGTAPTLVAGSIATPPGDDEVPVAVDRRTGSLVAAAPLPRYLVTAVPSAVGLRGRLVARADYVPLQLIEPARPPRATHLLLDLHPDGWMSAGETATLRVFGRELTRGARSCARVELEPPPRSPPGTAIARVGGTRRALALKPGQRRRAAISLPRGAAGRDFTDVRFDSSLAARLPDGRAVGPRLTVLGVSRC